MRNIFLKNKKILLVLIVSSLVGCSGYAKPERPLVPAIEYSRRLNSGQGSGPNAHVMAQQRYEETSAAQTIGIKSFQDRSENTISEWRANESKDAYDLRAAANTDKLPNPHLQPYGPPDLNPKDYNGPLSLGDPGQTSSLYRETGSSSDFFRDVRAWQPLDLITVKISEKTEGKKDADTEIKGKSTIKAAISGLLGLDKQFIQSNPDADLASLIGANTQNDFKGEGQTSRKDSLTGNISAMVVEVLPTGILRIEGTKIISVNNEEQIMVMTGLIRPRDITSENVVESSRIANMRIDYYGRGQLGDAQREGWLGRTLRTVWPF